MLPAPAPTMPPAPAPTMPPAPAPIMLPAPDAKDSSKYPRRFAMFSIPLGA
jgi:hypothetical protein